jgi:hypothetical protein
VFIALGLFIRGENLSIVQTHKLNVNIPFWRI